MYSGGDDVHYTFCHAVNIFTPFFPATVALFVRRQTSDRKLFRHFRTYTAMPALYFPQTRSTARNTTASQPADEMKLDIKGSQLALPFSPAGRFFQKPLRRE